MRVLAQYVRLDGQIHRLAVIGIPDDGSRPSLISADGETHSTVFFNGLILLAAINIELPPAVRASDALRLLASIPEPSAADPFKIAKIPFKP